MCGILYLPGAAAMLAIPHWLHVSCPLPSGRCEAVVLKVVVQAESEDSASWELRRILVYLLSHCRDIKVCKVLKVNKPVLLALWGACGLSEDEDLRLSLRTLQQRASALQGSASTAQHREESSVSSRGLVLMLLAWAGLRKKHECKARAIALLQGLLA